MYATYDVSTNKIRLVKSIQNFNIQHPNNMPPNQYGNKYKCDHVHCQLTFRNQSNLDDHVYLWHSKHVCGCKDYNTKLICEEFFPSKSKLAEHRRTHGYTSDDDQLTVSASHIATLEGHNSVFFGGQASEFKICVGIRDLRNQYTYIENIDSDRISKILTENNIKFESRHKVQFVSTSFATIDFRIIHNHHEIFLEIDSRVPVGYQIADDVKRMVQIFWARQSLMSAALPIVFIRYNPTHKVTASMYLSSMQPMYSLWRESKLISLITSPISQLFTGNPFSIQYMYYITDSRGKLDLHNHMLYDDRIANNHCLAPIIGEHTRLQYVEPISSDGPPRYTGFPPKVNDLPKPPHVCDKCLLAISTKSGLCNHIKNFHGNFVCGNIIDFKYKCELTFESKIECSKHRRSHK